MVIASILVVCLSELLSLCTVEVTVGIKSWRDEIHFSAGSCSQQHQLVRICVALLLIVLLTREYHPQLQLKSETEYFCSLQLEIESWGEMIHNFIFVTYVRLSVSQLKPFVRSSSNHHWIGMCITIQIATFLHYFIFRDRAAAAAAVFPCHASSAVCVCVCVCVCEIV